MGRLLEQVARQRGHEIAGIVDIDASTTIENAPAADVAIEFTHPAAAVQNIRACLQRTLPVVVGTTGWLDQLPQVDEACRATAGTVFYASNFSPGVNIFFELNEYLARLMAPQHGYEVAIEETHHTQKKDAPSGTAITLAEGIVRHHPQYLRWTTEKSDGPSALRVRSHRVDPTPGTHVITYSSDVDTIEIRHTAHSRAGFAVGAVEVAEWIAAARPRGLLTMQDFLARKSDPKA